MLIVTAAISLLFIILGLSFLRLFRELDRERREKSSIIENLSDGLILCDRSGRIILINKRATELLSTKSDPAMQVIVPSVAESTNRSYGLLPAVLFPKDAPGGIFKDIKTTREYRFLDPVELYLEVDTITSIDFGDGEEAQVLFLLRDVTRDRILSRLKSEFISIVAHQLRTPLAAIKWTFRLLLDEDLGPVNSNQQEYIQSGYDTNERIIRLVNDLLNVSRIEEGRFEYSFEECNLVELVKEAVLVFKNIAMSKRVILILTDPKKPIYPIAVDRDKIQMALQNLIENALYYTNEKGSVTVEVGEGARDLKVTIRDTGIGIPAHELKRLFTKFYRSESAVRMHPNGSGLGLFIARNVVLRHGGSIEVESEVGKGSTFRVILPKEKSSISVTP